MGQREMLLSNPKEKCNYKLEFSVNSFFQQYNEIDCQDDQSYFAECIKDTIGRA